MNDFTKEELRIIWLCLADYSYPEIKGKIQSLIGNYCEHEWLEGRMGSIYCKKCKKRINFKIL